MATVARGAAGEAPYLSIVIPAYNEARRIVPTLERIAAYCAAAPFASEVLVIDDGSSDGTADLAARTGAGLGAGAGGASNAAIQVLKNPGNRGKGYSVRRGALEARGEVVLFSDADLSTPIEEFDKFLPLLRSGEADVVIGSRGMRDSRIEKRQNAMREAGGRFFNVVLRALTGLPFRDTQCGFKAFRREAAREVFGAQRTEGWAFDVELILIALRRGYKVREVPVRWINSPESRLKVWRDGPRAFWDLLRIRWKDLRGVYTRRDKE